MTARDRERARRSRAGVQRDRLLSEWVTAYLNHVAASGARAATLRNYEAFLARMVRALGDVPARSVTPEQLEAWRDEQAETCKGTSVNRVLGACNTFFRWLEDEGGVDEAPTLYVDRCLEVDPQPKVLDPQVRRSIAKNADGANRTKHDVARDRAILSLLEDTGLRASECAGLLLENVDLRARQAFVHGEVAKGGRERTVVFGFETAKLLDKYLRIREVQRYAWCPQVFLSKFGPASYAAIRLCVKNAASRAGVIGARPHLYRHTFAHELKRAGAPDEVLMSLAGWATPTQLRRYGRAERTARAIETYQKLGSVVDRGSIEARSSVSKARPSAQFGKQTGTGS